MKAYQISGSLMILALQREREREHFELEPLQEYLQLNDGPAR